MGGCWSFQEPIYVPVPPGGWEEPPPPGFEYVPLDEYIVAIEIRTNNTVTRQYGFSKKKEKDPWNDTIFT